MRDDDGDGRGWERIRVERRDDGRAIVTVIGKLDASVVDELAAATADLDIYGITTLVVDMSQMTGAPSSVALGCLLNVADDLRAREGEVVVVKPPPQARLVLEMLGLESFFRIVDSLDDAGNPR